MITITQEGTKVKVTIDPGMSDGKVALLYWECDSDWYAELLAVKMRNKLEDTVMGIREEQYLQGWKDAKAKKAKRNWFTSVLKRVW